MHLPYSADWGRWKKKDFHWDTQCETMQRREAWTNKTNVGKLQKSCWPQDREVWENLKTETNNY